MKKNPSNYSKGDTDCPCILDANILRQTHKPPDYFDYLFAALGGRGAVESEEKTQRRLEARRFDPVTLVFPDEPYSYWAYLVIYTQ